MQTDDAAIKPNGAGNDRIAFLDGFRGIAILLVVGFHYFARFSADSRGIYPYGDVLAAVPVFEYGFYGVMLFFSVSGFVIALTLERTRSFFEFAVRRFARLWPTMVLCAGLTYLVLLAWPLFWIRQPIDFLPSLTFLDGHLFWGRLSPALESQWIDGVYWTLFVEVRFYLFAGLIYFMAPRHFARNMLGFLLVVVGVYAGCRTLGQMYVVGILHESLIAPFVPWFTGGMAAYEAWRGRTRMALLLATASLLLMAWLWRLHAPDASLPVALGVAALFLAGLYWPAAQRVLSMRWLTVVGVSSYSLYLLHENLGLTLIGALAKRLQLSGPPSLWLAVLVGLAMIGLSWLVYCYWEHPLNRRIVRAWSQWSSRAEVAGATTLGLRRSE